MGRGGDGRASASAKKSMDINKLASSFKDDMVVLKNIWFGSKSGKDHAARLESFYGPQASACEAIITDIRIMCLIDRGSSRSDSRLSDF